MIVLLFLLAIVGLLFAFAIFIFITNIDIPWIFSIPVSRYRKLDAINHIETTDIVFTGSSVMKYWHTIEKDLYPFQLLNRAIPGIKINELNHYIDQLVLKYNPKKVFIYAGSNDIQGMSPKSPEHVYNGFKYFVEHIHQKNNAIKIYYISIITGPSKLRLKHRDEINRANKLIETYCKETNLATYVDVQKHFLTDAGVPNKELFIEDGIHLKPEAYRYFTAEIMNELK